MFVVCEKWVETRTDCYIDPSSSLDHSSTSFASWLGLLTKGLKPTVCSWFSLRHPVSNWLEPPGHLVILFSNTHLLPLFFRLFTPVHLLIDGSVEGQYITFVLNRITWYLITECKLIKNAILRNAMNIEKKKIMIKIKYL